MYSGMVLMVVCCRYRMPFDTNGCVSTLMNVILYAKTSNEHDKSVMRIDLLRWLYFRVSELKLVLMIVYFLVMNSKRAINSILLLFYSG